MINIKGLAEDVLGEALETGQSTTQQVKQFTPTQVATNTLEQVTGSVGSPQKNDLAPGLEDLKDKKIPPEKLKKMQEGDGQKTNQDLTNTRLGLERAKREKIQRYQQMQQKVLNVSKTKEQEEMKKEQTEYEEAQRKQQEEAAKNQALEMPHKGESGPNLFAIGGKKKKKSILSIFAKQNQGTGEIRTAKLG